MKKLLLLGALFALALPGVVSASEVDLATYLRLLLITPGTSIERKIDTLTSLGITLSVQGLRDLEVAAATQGTASPRSQNGEITPTWSPRGSYDSDDADGAVGSQGYRRPSLHGYSNRLLPRPTELPRLSYNPYSTRPDGYYSLGNPISGTSTRLGGITFYNFSDGTSGTANQLGRTTFYNFSNGTSGTANRLGNTTFYNYNNGLSGTTTQLGNFGFHNLNNGLSGTSSQVGDFTFHNFSNGTNCTTSRIGSYVYTNCY